MSTKRFDYPYFGQHPWYAILLQDKFLSCFFDESYYLSVSGDKYKRFKEVWREFAEIVQGMTMGCAMSNTTPKEKLIEDCMKMSPIIGMAFCHYMYTCPSDPVFFANLWHTMDKHNPVIPERLSPSQLVVSIFSPFWHRMGINEEEEFVRSGKLGHYLQLLRAKTTLPQ